MTPEFLQQLQQGAAAVGNAAQSGGLSALFAPGTLSPLDPLYDYAKTAPILSLKGNKEYENLNFQALPDTNYQLTVGGQVVGSASNPQEVAALVNQANAISEQGGKKVDVRLQKEVGVADKAGNPYTAFSDVYVNQPNNNGFLDIALPAALAAISGGALGPLLGGGFLGTGAAAGLGSVAGSLGTGDSLKNALIKGALTGVTAGALSGLGAAAPAASSTTGAGAAGAGAAGAAGASAAAPVAGEILVQAARPLLSSALSSGIGAGLGNIGSSLVQPDQFQQALDQARLDNQFGPAPEADMLTVTGSPQASASPLASVPAAISTLTPSQQAPAVQEAELLAEAQRMPDQQIEGPLAASASDAIRNIVGAQELLGNQPATPEEEIDVTGRRIEDVTTGPLASLPASAVSDVVTNYKPPEPVESLIEKQAKKIDDADEITVTAKPIEATGSFGAALPGLAMTLPAMTAAQAISPTAATPPAKKGMSTFGKITGGLAILDALGNLVGGGGGGGAGAGGATGLDALAPTFRAQLPTPRGQFTPQALTQRPPGEAGRPDIDYARYGYGPARSFFNYVPETQAERDAFAATAAAPAAPRVGVGTVMPQALPGAAAAPTGATDTVLRAGFEKLRAAVPGASDAELVAFLGTPEGQQQLAMIFEDLGATPRAKGGSMGGNGRSRESFAVNGEGTGRSDEIPALLSDGEYVIDAETVALLGDGSGKAGAQRLDEFRAKIRKHKGRNLAKGKFSVNAKRPERYLSGGLV
jgi:hypothetical protein